MLRATLLSLLVVLLSVPAASASIGSPTCQVTVQDWDESVHCGTTTTAVSSSENWCPPGSRCGYFDILVCDGTLLFPCTVL
ncbi:MAG: hypothetical protein QOE90_3129 [Thermoplasmata archaeon]|jgi:hypothetical protein|nr:hypothetical protein [Thermoplasmata archaeon]